MNPTFRHRPSQTVTPGGARQLASDQTRDLVVKALERVQGFFKAKHEVYGVDLAGWLLITVLAGFQAGSLLGKVAPFLGGATGVIGFGGTLLAYHLLKARWGVIKTLIMFVTVYLTVNGMTAILALKEAGGDWLRPAVLSFVVLLGAMEFLDFAAKLMAERYASSPSVAAVLVGGGLFILLIIIGIFFGGPLSAGWLRLPWEVLEATVVLYSLWLIAGE